MTWSSARPGVVHAADGARWAPVALDLSPPPPPPAAPTAPTPAPVELAFAEGHEAGRLEGERAEQARLRFAREAAEEALAAIHEGEARWAGAVEENICALAVAVARHIIAREVAADPTIVADLVRRAVDDFGIERGCRIRVHPQDHALLAADAEADPAADREARWVADPTVARGGCVVEGRERIVDGRVDTALERLYRRLTYTGA